jgi:hypothetical protein
LDSEVQRLTEKSGRNLKIADDFLNTIILGIVHKYIYIYIYYNLSLYKINVFTLYKVVFVICIYIYIILYIIFIYHIIFILCIYHIIFILYI